MKLAVKLAVILVTIMGLVSQVRAASKLSTIFQDQMLRAQVAYLETITGPAMHIFPGRDGLQRRDYQVEACKVIAYARGSVVIGYSLELTPKCNFDLGNFMGDRYSSTRGLTIGKFIEGGFGSDMRVQSTCIDLCGNAADPTVDFTFEGPHALNFISIVLTVTLADQNSVDAAERWAKVMRDKEGDGYVRKAGFNCTTEYDDAGIKAFENATVSQITVGYEPNATLYKKSCTH